MKNLPYGIQNFEIIRNKNLYYVDKTKFIEQIENEPACCLMFLRPRRFGKTLLISTLESYYDKNKANDFEKLFKGTYIYDNPTPLKNSYYVLRLDFSKVKVFDDLNDIEEAFTSLVSESLLNFYLQYPETGGKEAFNERPNKRKDACSMFNSFSADMQSKKITIYLLIDEYDNFANNILTQHGKDTYENVTHKGGFIRSFFSILKACTSECIERIFMTGVSPMLLSDMTSGFNIALSISLNENYHNLVGFNQEEFDEMISYYINEGIVKKEDREAIQTTCKEYYNNYRFSKRNVGQVYNSNLIIYYLNNYIQNSGLHDDLLDKNILTDFAKLKNIVIYDKKLNGNYSVLSELMTTGTTSSRLVDIFPMEEIRDVNSFKSLLFYLGLTTIKDVNVFGNFNFVIPNKTIENIHFTYIRNALKDAFDVYFNINKIEVALQQMVTTGNAIPALQIIADTFYDTASLRDFVESEASFKAYLLAYFSIASFLNIYSEREFNKGFADVFVEANSLVYNLKSAGFLIELKYVRAKERTEEHIKELEKQATEQLNSYAKDAYFKNREVKKLIFILSAKQVEVLKEIE